MKKMIWVLVAALIVPAALSAQKYNPYVHREGKMMALSEVLRLRNEKAAKEAKKEAKKQEAIKQSAIAQEELYALVAEYKDTNYGKVLEDVADTHAYLVKKLIDNKKFDNSQARYCMWQDVLFRVEDFWAYYSELKEMNNAELAQKVENLLNHSYYVSSEESVKSIAGLTERVDSVLSSAYIQIRGEAWLSGLTGKVEVKK